MRLFRERRRADRLTDEEKVSYNKGYILLNTNGFNSNSRDECYEAVQKAKEGR